MAAHLCMYGEGEWRTTSKDFSSLYGMAFIVLQMASRCIPHLECLLCVDICMFHLKMVEHGPTLWGTAVPFILPNSNAPAINAGTVQGTSEH